MTVQPPVHNEYISYEIILNQVLSGMQGRIVFTSFLILGGVPTEAARDALFQAFLNKCAELPGVTLVSAKKIGGYTSTVTVG